MKILIVKVLVLLSLASQVFGQVKDGSSVFLREAVIDSIPMSKPQIRDKSKEWIGKSFKSGETVIASETESSIIGHYTSVRVGSLGHQFVWEHTISIDIKDGKSRVKIWVNRMLTGTVASEYWFTKYKPSKVHQRWLEEMMMESQKLIESYHDFVIQKGDDW